MATALLIIDVQNAVLAGDAPAERRREIDRAFDETVERLCLLQQQARAAAAPVIMVQHNGGIGNRLEKGTSGWEIRQEVAPQPQDIVVEKKSADSFFDTDLCQVMTEQGISRLVVGGCMSQYCVDTTVRRAVSLGYDVLLVADGHTSSDSRTLPFTDIVQHHNEILDGFNAGRSMVRVVKAADVQFG
ncbi:isochorismatase family protein [Thalassospira sp. TSL5-1]|uniref:isochorismatase family protein n=1 Tax=Thalassospira sp. TSL5-1 TaxID=1544451 RepID=UPI00093CCBB0|nr:isochorismatase family protein [Thalassospira sp. TSL5-1]OKH88799.1 isochorismatase [Thalassospira sp. TSL5-1]